MAEIFNVVKMDKPVDFSNHGKLPSSQPPLSNADYLLNQPLANFAQPGLYNTRQLPQIPQTTFSNTSGLPPMLPLMGNLYQNFQLQPQFFPDQIQSNLGSGLPGFQGQTLNFPASRPLSVLSFDDVKAAKKRKLAPETTAIAQETISQVSKQANIDASQDGKKAKASTKPRTSRKVNKCKSRNCTKNSRGKSGYCVAHGGGRRCEKCKVRCARPYSNFCSAHGGGERCRKPQCLKGAVSGTLFCRRHRVEAKNEQ